MAMQHQKEGISEDTEIILKEPNGNFGIEKSNN